MQWYTVRVEAFVEVYARDAEEALELAPREMVLETVACEVYDPDTGEEL